jgi:hypothetical protein
MVDACRTDIHHKCFTGVIEAMRNIMRSTIIAIVATTALSVSPALYAVGVGCTAQYKQAVDECSNMGDWADRSICGLDAAVEYAGCVRRTIMS